MKEVMKKFHISQFLMFTLPITFQVLLRNMIGITDNFMVGTLGPEYMAGLKIATGYFFFFVILLFGVTGSAGILMSQAWGAKNRQLYFKTAGGGILLTLLVSAMLSLVSMSGSRLLASWMISGEEVQVIRYASEYLRIIGIGFLFLGFSSILSSILTSSGDTATPFIQQCVVTGLNVVLNYLLIFGKFGFPRMEVAGAALASVISIVAGNVVLVIALIYKKMFPSLKNIIFPDRPVLKNLITNAAPITGDMFVWQIAMIIYLKLIGMGGVTDLAVYGVVGTFFSMLFLTVSGFVMGTGTICSQNIGAGYFKAAYRNALKSWKIALLVSGLVSIVLIGISWMVPDWFKLEGHAYIACLFCLVILAIRQVFATTNGVMANVIRSGKDSVSVMLITLSGFIFVGLPVAMIAGPVLKTGIIGIFIGISLEEAFKAVLFFIRFRSRKWLVRSIGRPELIKAEIFQNT